MGFVDRWMGGESLGSKLSKGLPGLLLSVVFAVISIYLIGIWLGDTAKAATDAAVTAKTLTKGASLGFGHWATTLTQVLHINYYIFLLVVGIIIRNTIGVPKVFHFGLGQARPIIKPGIILLGATYTVTEALAVAAKGIILILVFVWGTAFAILWLGTKYKVSTGLTGSMAAGVGICGVSAIIASAAACRAKVEELTYGLATILLFGLVCLITFPYIALALNIPQNVFGAWVGTAILNTAQLQLAAAIYDPTMAAGAVKTATIVNIVRVIMIPFIVIAIALYYIARMGTSEKVDKMQVIKDKFPIFVLGFVVLLIMNTMKMFNAEQLAVMVKGTKPATMSAIDRLLAQPLMNWLWAIGFAGIGLSVNLADMKAAGGTAFKIGFGVGAVKAVLSLGLAWMFFG